MINESYIKVLHVDLTTQKVHIARREDIYPLLGGVGVASALYEEVMRPDLDPLASELSDEFERQSFEFLYSMIEEARREGEIRRSIATATAAYLIDNHLMLFAFSFVSLHYDRRFHQYFGKDAEQLDAEAKINVIMRSFRELLG